MTTNAQVVADQLGLLLQRRVRRNLHAEVVHNVHHAVDASTYPILSGIARYGEATAAALGAELGVDRALVSRKAVALTQAGLLATRVDPNDRRSSLLSLTAEGDRVIEQLRLKLMTVIDHHLRDWPAQDRRRFAHLLARFVTAIGDSTDQADDDAVGSDS